MQCTTPSSHLDSSRRIVHIALGPRHEQRAPDGCVQRLLASSVGNRYAVYPSRRHVPPAVTAFVEMTVQRLTPLIQLPISGTAVSG